MSAIQSTEDKGQNGLAFEPEKHTYKLDGRPVTSVTAILMGGK